MHAHLHVCTKLFDVLPELHSAAAHVVHSPQVKVNSVFPSVFPPESSTPLAACQAWAFLRLLSFPWPCILVPPPPEMIEKCFKHNAYLCVHRHALNMQIILFSSSVSSKVYLSKNPIIPDNYYPERPLEVSMLTDHSSQHGSSSLPILTYTHTRACISSCCLNQQASCRVYPNILLMQCKWQFLHI